MTHFANRRVGNIHKGIRVSGEQISAVAAQRREISKPNIVLTAAIMEMFVKKYLMFKLDDPKPTPPFHLELWEDCCSACPRVADAAPRSHAKSTAVTLAFVLAMNLFRQRDFTLIVSDTWAQSIEFLGDLKTELMENEEIRADFGIMQFIKDTQDDVIIKMEDGYKFRIVARGAEQKVRGLKWNNKRPNLIIGDDLEGDEQVESKQRRDKFFKWFMKALLPCGSDDCLFRIVGTILHFDSALERLMKDPTWKTRRYSAHASYDDFSAILWPEKFSERRLRGIRDQYIAQGEADSYSCEYLNNPIAEGDAFFRREDLVEMTDNQRKDILDGKLRLTYYAGWDFAVSKDTKSDYTVGSVWGLGSDGMKYKVDLRRGRWDAKEIVDEMFQVERAYAPATHFVEAGTINNSIDPFLAAEMMKRNIYLNLTKIVSTKDKKTRAGSLQGVTRQRHLIVDKQMSDWAEMEEEYARFPKGQHDDIVDADSIICLGMRDHIAPDSEEEVAEEEYFRGRQASGEDGRSAVTGY
jgi:predicted phage terminase large subunit-like protein